jgi:hypothetical protein
MTMEPKTVPWGWVAEHYATQPAFDGSPAVMLCTRCGAEVDWLTKHAVERHGDTDIEVMPTIGQEPVGGWKW